MRREFLGPRGGLWLLGDDPDFGQRSPSGNEIREGGRERETAKRERRSGKTERGEKKKRDTIASARIMDWRRFTESSDGQVWKKTGIYRLPRNRDPRVVHGSRVTLEVGTR